MKNSILFLAFLSCTIFSSCSNSSITIGKRFIGTWKSIISNNIHVEGMESYLTDKMAIKKDGELYLMKMGPISNQGFGPNESVFELKEGKLVGNDGIVYYLESSGHLRTGGSVWEKISDNTW